MPTLLTSVWSSRGELIVLVIMSNDSLPDRLQRRWYVPNTWKSVLIVVGLLAEVVVLLYVSLSVLYFQIARPKIPKIYYTNDPLDIVRKGESYTCGCSLPAIIQSPDNPSQNPDFSINRCYEKSELETVRVLMFPNETTGATLQPVLNAFVPEQVYYKKISEGYFLGQEAHDLSGSVVENPMDDIKTLFLNGNRLVDYLSTVSYMRDNLVSFPKSFLRLAFSYKCNDCATCALDYINEISTEVSNDERWATCFYWGLGDNCQNGNTYIAKCVLYPTKSLPPNFAIRGFFERFLSLPGIEDIHHVTPGIAGPSGNSTSLQPSSLYLNISQIESSSISMGFVEVVRGSAFRVSVLSLFPAMDTSCSNINKVRLCNGTSVCNVFTNDKSTKNYELRCKDLVNRTQCLSLMAESFIDNAGSLYQGNWDDVNCGLANRPPQCFNIMPNLVAWNVSHRVARNMDAMNEFLYNNILQDEWAQRTGVCTNTFEDVFRYPPKNAQNESASGNELGGDNHTIYLESDCTSTVVGREYCWLTGRYHNITDNPNKSGQLEWKELRGDPLFPDAPLSPRFACYRVDRQGMATWLIVSFGTIFGWISTVHMIFRVFWWVIPKVALRLDENTCCPQWRLFRSMSETSSTGFR